MWHDIMLWRLHVFDILKLSAVADKKIEPSA
jgi:hypothetical protein